MNWYLAKIVYHILCDEGEHEPQFDEQLRLITAEDELQAFLKARRLGEREEESFLNQQLKTVRWKFIDVSELYLVSKLTDGVEIYSRIQEQERTGFYIDTIRRKAAHLYERCLQQSVEVV
ncbi:MAG: DUF4288 domain-containing protein [Chitinophagaceae bacterium]|nr:DUF4288 domain-containing protein [Chitinophagaceae bacterium]